MGIIHVCFFFIFVTTLSNIHSVKTKQSSKWRQSQHLDLRLLWTLVLMFSLYWALSWEAVIHCFPSMNEVLCWERAAFCPAVD